MHNQTGNGQYICISGKFSKKPISFPNQPRLDKHKTCHANEKCDSKGKSGEFLVQLTDKSGQLCVDTKDNYVASMQPHIENDLVISLEERDKTERILNGHCIQLTRILKMGQDHGHETQVRSAVTCR